MHETSLVLTPKCYLIHVTLDISDGLTWEDCIPSCLSCNCFNVLYGNLECLERRLIKYIYYYYYYYYNNQ